MNELLWIGFALMDLSLVLVIYRFFGKTGLFGLIVFNLILCNIQVLKTIELFGMTTTLGNILYASVFLSTDMLSEFYGKKEAKKAVYLGFVVLLMAVVYMQLALMFTPAADDFAQPHLEAIFGFLPRIALGSMAAYIVSQLNDVYIFHLLKDKMGQRHLWLRNNASTLLSQFLDSSVFCLVALWGLFPFEVWVEILFTTYLFKVIVAVMDTPFLYMARRLHSKVVES
ncbi:queuosine precursor transporter [Desulfovibrio sp. JC010]|uniref:queuosine precursor transporter n=1 Tax=Desulfovibrio sp. JC010 TaxID=2593641 RepID=UPI0013D3D9D5|nr:queuosine precursor transporter [Desulfovibrio sp. JC010]NDV26329.1 queuosine precursor transporter [Desulfovibrio sp. JC010]